MTARGGIYGVAENVRPNAQANASLLAQIEKLKEALRPFAEVAKSYDDFMPEALPNKGGELIFPLLNADGTHMLIGIGEEDFRRARAALGRKP